MEAYREADVAHMLKPIGKDAIEGILQREVGKPTTEERSNRESIEKAPFWERVRLGAQKYFRFLS